MNERSRNDCTRMGPFQEYYRNYECYPYIRYGKPSDLSTDLYTKIIIVASPSTDSQSKHLKFQNHRKFIYKQKHINKHHVKAEPKHEERHSHYTHCAGLKRDILPEKDLKSKQKGLEYVLDWMMEAASLMKVTKNSLYRSFLVFKKIYEIDPNKCLSYKKATFFACGSLAIGVKFEGIPQSCIESISSRVAGRRVSREELLEAEASILKMIDWHIPVDVFIEEELQEITRCWNEYLSCLGRQTEDRLMSSKIVVNPWQKVPTSLYLQIVYLIDFLVIKRHFYFLKSSRSFKLPILMSFYINLSLTVGDMKLNVNILWSSFQKFIRLYQLLSEQQISNFKNDLPLYFLDLNIVEILANVPCQNFSKIIKKWNEQFYIPKVTHIQ